MNNKLYFITIFILLVSFLPTFVVSYQIQPSQDVIIQRIQGYHYITKTGALESMIEMTFYTESNYSLKHPNLTISFYPEEIGDNEPIRVGQVAICSGYNPSICYVCGNSPKCNISQDGEQKRGFIDNGKMATRNYQIYKVRFVPEKIEQEQVYKFRMNYTLPNFVFKQGDYSVAWLVLRNLNSTNIEIVNTIALPSEEDIPRFIPDAKSINTAPYNEENISRYRWEFTFEGGGDKIIWYWNEKDIQEKERKLQEEYTYKGVWLGVAVSLIISAIRLFLKKLFSVWKPFGNKISKFLTNNFKFHLVIGNPKSKTYHKPSCAFVDNIDERNRKIFKNKKKAEQEGYSSCKICS